MPPADEQLWILAGLALLAAVLGLVVRSLMRGKPAAIAADGPLRVMVRPLKAVNLVHQKMAAML